MRFWNAFVAIALVPVVAADFYFGQVVCYAWNLSVVETYATMLPANNNKCLTAVKPDSEYYQQQRHHVYGSTMTAQICGASITVTLHNSHTPPSWTSSDGGSGRCISLDPSLKGNQPLCGKYFPKLGLLPCAYTMNGVCDSYLCK
ncbi:uncharacterized protein EI90DRAFT_3171916 [Cantharellus anzutake]|uniref:uncharacterized protein n=1 Tax=Cantharellus anzutake TaxID=1750568 RepID=UPI0019031F16|nr:uncharacterized protein EI90DRAFT_3171916 [Cantharellus anzutake]KAF8335732.1 hypothetical protein EI90DRAFT_3171916 [Cantharellus anzutake]